MRAEHINPFLNSVANTFRTMLNTEVRRGTVTLADPRVRNYPVSGIIGLSGNASGTVVINLSREVAIRAASTMLMEPLHDLSDEVLDAVGELTNVIAGQAKTQLAEYNLSVSLPNVVTGEKHEVRFPSRTAPICVPFETDLGPLQLEVGFDPAL